MKYFTSIILLLSASGFSQNYTAISQTAIAVQQSNTTIINNNNNMGLSMIAYELAAFRNSWDNRKRREEALSKAQSQISMVKNQYDSAGKFPDKIIDGWHQVFATDNYNYCSPAKVLIENNEIKQFVVSNWIKLSRPFSVLSPIKKGKALIALDLIGNTDTLEVYFLNDLLDPTTVQPPQNSAYISFWSDLGLAKSIKIWCEGVYFGELAKQFKAEPDCGEAGTITIEVKPGTHFFKGAGRGTISWEGSVEAREGLCLKYILNRENDKN